MSATVLAVDFDSRETRFVADGVTHAVPVGIDTLAGMITSDPPLPEELINAIGLLMDHVEDVLREVPAAAVAERIECTGVGLDTLAAVEVGGVAENPFTLNRDAAEEVFRTLATESAADRAFNPGLPTTEVHRILGVCCAVVAVLRALHAPLVILNR